MDAIASTQPLPEGEASMQRKQISAWVATLLVAGAAGGTAVALDGAQRDDAATLARGRYIVKTSGCNDCHTPGYLESNGTTPESEWLTGAPVGFQGPWGTTYAQNLRLYMQTLTEDAWVGRARAPTRPPMPWFNLAAMTDDDLRAVYQYVRALGAKGEPPPQYAGPGEPVRTPVFVFVPQPPAPHQAAMR
jgi:mono/diheme cytochrome c family protein